MPYNKIVLDGYLGAGVEAWSVGFAVAGAGDTAEDDSGTLTDWANEILAEFGGATGWPGDIRSMWGSNGGLSRVKIYYYPNFSSPATSVGQSTGASVAGSGTITLPPQCTLAVSLLTAIPGRRTRGRFYMPFLTGTMTSSLKISTTIALNSRASSMRDMLNFCAAASGSLPDAFPVVVSKAGSLVTPVTTVRVGDVVDTQRRRRDALVESYGSAAV